MTINGRDAKDYDPYAIDQASGLWSSGVYASIDPDGTVRGSTEEERAKIHKEFAKKGAAQRKDQDQRAREAEQAFQEKKGA